MADLPVFDLTGPLPTGTTLLEASAGTGKTFTVAGLVTRYLAEGAATIEELLVVTFGRAASQEMRERVRAQLVEAERALSAPNEVVAGRNAVVDHLLAEPSQVGVRRERLRTALAGFDGATIATTHQFCQLVLRSLGVAGDSDGGDALVENLDDLVVEVVDDLYLARFGQLTSAPFTRAVALTLAREAIGDSLAVLAGVGLDAPSSLAAARVEFAAAVREEVAQRKRERGVLSYDDLLRRLAEALDGAGAGDGDGVVTAACERMRDRWHVVLVDEFQDTDPTQWQVLQRAFHGHAAMVLIGDPKQAIYAFRGGDVVTYLDAARACETRATLGTNWRSDAPLVQALQVMLRGAALGDPDIVVREVTAHHRESRLREAPHAAPLRVRRLPRTGFRLARDQIRIAPAREAIAADCAADIAALLGSGARWEARPLCARDVAVIVSKRDHGLIVQRELALRGVTAVVAGGGHVFTTDAAEEWMRLLDALDQPHRAPFIRSAALTCFLPYDAADLAAGGDALVDEIADRIRDWSLLLRTRGVAALVEALDAAGLSARVLARPDGERLLTDLRHLGQLLHEAAVHDRLSLSATVQWFRDERLRSQGSERPRRLDSDAEAVQIVTVHGSKGLQYPVTYLPFAFEWFQRTVEIPRFHHDGVRSIDVRGSGQDWSAHVAAHQREESGEELRRLYVALTRAQSQVVTWWAPTTTTATGALHRMLFGRQPYVAEVPDEVAVREDEYAARVLALLGELGALSPELVEISDAVLDPPLLDPDAVLAARRFDRDVDAAWRRTSHSALVRVVDHAPAATSEPEEPSTDDEPDEPSSSSAIEDAGVPGASGLPMADLPAGAAFGTLVHAVLEHADPSAPDLAGELRDQIVDQARFGAVDLDPDALTEALVAAHRTPLGPLLPGLTLADLPWRDRLRELDFELPLGGGDRSGAPRPRLLRDLAPLLRRHLPADDLLAAYADRLEHPVLGEQPLRGYLAGSIDVVFRVRSRDSQGGERFVVADYKTNRLTPLGAVASASDYTPEAMAASMLHSDYPLQALLYSVVLHRYLRWRLPGYDPDRHLGGVVYLYLRGMGGAEAPLTDAHPSGVFSWQPPAALIVELSDLLDGGGA